MSPTLVVWILTVLAAVVIVLTRKRLGSTDGAGHAEVSRASLNAHTASGVLALLLWVPYLLAPEKSWFSGEVAGILAIAAWWSTAAWGVLILMRWMPSRGRHATGNGGDTWSDGPGLSILAHVGMLVGVAVFTWTYLDL